MNFTLHDAGSEPVDSLRRCALTLHSLGDDDREWVLSRLPAQQGVELRSLLNELRELSIPSDPALVRAALTAGEESRGLPHWCTRSLAAALESEPTVVIARALQLVPIADHDKVMAQLPAATRQKVARLLADGQLAMAPGQGGRLRDALFCELEQRVERA